MMLERLMAAVGAYGAVLLQISVLATWPLFGGQPSLVAVGGAVFLMMRRPVLGLWWVVTGGVLVDLLLPARFGVTALPLVLSYIVSQSLLRWAIEGVGWWNSLVLGLFLLVSAHLPVTIMTGAWTQLLHDLAAGALLLLPISGFIASFLGPVQSGLRIGR